MVKLLAAALFTGQTEFQVVYFALSAMNDQDEEGISPVELAESAMEVYNSIKRTGYVPSFVRVACIEHLQGSVIWEG